ncbi:MAG: c-type cytochrome, partial [Gammaproteobacteria bacterium]|nr:c-type cytochrome [Gammaproteobacteria bacterium]
MTVRRVLGITALVIGAVVLAGIGVVAYLYYEGLTHEPLAVAYGENCGVCHGENMEGTGQGTPLVGIEFRHGETVEEIAASIANGFPAQGMPGWSDILPETEIRKLAIYISEQRSDLGRDFRVGMALEIPEGTIGSALHDFRIETFAEGLDPWPYSISPLPDGRFLVTEKKRGLRIVSADGEP